MKDSQIRSAFEFLSDEYDPSEHKRLNSIEQGVSGQTKHILSELEAIYAESGALTPLDHSEEAGNLSESNSNRCSDPEDPTDKSTWTLDYFAIVRERPANAPNCFGHLFKRDPTHEDCMNCRFIIGCGLTQQSNIKRYADWLKRNRVGEDNIGVAYSRDRRLAVTGAGAPPALTATPSTKWAWLFRAIDLAHMRRSDEKKRVADREKKRVARSNPSFAERVETCAALRRTALEKASGTATKDKRLQQLRGRSEELALFWKATALATDSEGRTPSADRISRIYNSFVGGASLSSN